MLREVYVIRVMPGRSASWSSSCGYRPTPRSRRVASLNIWRRVGEMYPIGTFPSWGFFCWKKLQTMDEVSNTTGVEEHHSQGNYFRLFSGSNTTAAVGANRSC